MEINTFSLYL